MIDIDRQRFKTATVGGDTFVLDERTGETYRFGGAASRLWDLLLAGRTVPGAAQAVATATGAPYERVLQDTEAFVSHLRAAGIIDSSV